MGRELKFSEKLTLLLAVFAVHLCYAGSHIISRVALNLGTSKLIFLLYRNIIAVVLLAPFAYFLEKKDRPSLTFSILIHFFLIALCGITANQGFYIWGLYYLSPTYVSAIQNSMPALTFAIAVALRSEKLNIKKKYGIAKLVGTVVCIGGATILTLYKGPPLLKDSLHLSMEAITSSHIMNWTLGCVFILLNCVAWSGWMVLQVPLLARYPARLSATTLTCFFGLIQFICITAFSDFGTEKWKFHSEGELVAILYTGVVGTGIAFSLQIWCIDRVGPLIVAVFQPLQTVLVALLAAFIFGDEFYLGALIGFILIIMGLYCVLWGKNEERKIGGIDTSLTSHLLQQQEYPHKDMP